MENILVPCIASAHHARFLAAFGDTSIKSPFVLADVLTEIQRRGTSVQMRSADDRAGRYAFVLDGRERVLVRGDESKFTDDAMTFFVNDGEGRELCEFNAVRRVQVPAITDGTTDPLHEVRMNGWMQAWPRAGEAFSAAGVLREARITIFCALRIADALMAKQNESRR